MKKQSPYCATTSCRQQGIALIAVLWIVAALSVVVTGVVHSVRSEVRVINHNRQALEGLALGQAAIALVLQDISVRAQRPAQLMQIDVVYLGHAMQVQVMPLSGLIDINSASEPLLISLYSVAGAKNEAVATALAQATLQVRGERDTRGREKGFEAAQDLLRVPGVDFDLYARLSPLITAEVQGGSGRVNPQAAPVEVLAVLAQGNLALAGDLAAKRASGATDMDTTRLNAPFIGNLASSRYKLQARVPFADGIQVVVSHSVDARPDSRSGLPWRVFHTEYWTQAGPMAGV
jgi:general secretion pathway protein K